MWQQPLSAVFRFRGGHLGSGVKGDRVTGTALSEKRFTGEEEFKVDSKGRVSIPAKFRTVLESQDPEWTPGKTAKMYAVFGGHLDGYVECYSAETMSETVEMILRLPQAAPRTKMMRRWYISQSTDFAIDDTGRIVLPAKLREKIGVEQGGTVLFAGVGKTFQIWRPEAYEAMVAEQEEKLLAEEGDFDPEALLDDLRAASPGGEG